MLSRWFPVRWSAVPCALLICLVLSTATAAAQEDLADSSPVLNAGETELIESLEQVGLLDEWIETAPVSRQAALLHVSNGHAYAEARENLLQGTQRLVERQRNIVDRSNRLDAVDAQIIVLEELIRDVRRDVIAQGRAAPVSLTVGQVSRARLMLGVVSGDYGWRGFSLDSVALAERQLATVRDQLSREVDNLVWRDGRRNKSTDAVVAGLTRVHTELDRLRSFVQTGRERDTAGQFELMGHRAELVDLMPPLHEQRTLGTTQFAGLTLVTVDAYFQGAATLDPSCPVDWTLLAGIGRVESRHGTVDDAVVQSSGRVSQSILGPLLDGGATAREEAEAEAAAEEAAAEAALLAELEALAEAERQAQYDPAVWGEETLERAEEVAREAEGFAEPVGRAAIPIEEPVEEDENDEADEEEEEEQRGNGFAVIEDSDDGRLDGNDRWDRAVGPMQFIPQTWSYWDTDGNGDGITDPQNLYDAAASAGRFLCSLSRSRGASPSTFVLGYNSSQTYVRNVLSFADAYGAFPLPE